MVDEVALLALRVLLIADGPYDTKLSRSRFLRLFSLTFLITNDVNINPSTTTAATAATPNPTPNPTHTPYPNPALTPAAPPVVAAPIAKL